MKGDYIPMSVSRCARNESHFVWKFLSVFIPSVAMTQRTMDTIMVTISIENSAYKIQVFFLESCLTLERIRNGMTRTAIHISHDLMEEAIITY
jgi:hypothetical protein